MCSCFNSPLYSLMVGMSQENVVFLALTFLAELAVKGHKLRYAASQKRITEYSDLVARMIKPPQKSCISEFIPCKVCCYSHQNTACLRNPPPSTIHFKTIAVYPQTSCCELHFCYYA